MKMTVTISDKAGSKFSCECPPDPSSGGRARFSKNCVDQWLKIDCHHCPGCSLTGEAHPLCPAALSIVDIVDSPLTGLPSYQPVEITVERGNSTWRCDTSLDRALGLQILYRLSTSRCPLFAHTLHFLDFFVPPDTHHKIIFQYLAIHLMITNIIQSTGGAELNRLEPERAAVVFEHMLMRIRSRKQSIADAIPNALCSMHAIFQLMQQDEALLYGQLRGAFC